MSETISLPPPAPASAPTAAPTWRSHPRWAALRTLLHYQGMWALGVGLMRNLSLRGKAIVVALCVAVPLGLVSVALVRSAGADVAEGRRVAEGIHRYKVLTAARRAARELGRESDAADQRRSTGGTATALRDEQRSFAALGEAVATTTEPSTSIARAFQLAASVHAKLMTAASESAGLAAEPAGLPTQRFEALGAYLRALDLLHAESLQAFALHLDDDPVTAALQEGPVRWMPKLERLLFRLGQGDDMGYARTGQTTRVGAVHEAALEARFVLDLMRRSLDQLAARGDLDTQALQNRLALIGSHLDAALRVGRTAGLADGPEAVAGSAGIDRAAHAALARQSLAAAEAIEADALALLERRVALRERRVHTELTRGTLWLALCVAMTVYLLVCAYKVIAGGLGVLCWNLDEFGRGNLAIRPRGLGSDEIGRALTTLGASAARMATLFEAVTQGVAAVSHASREVAQGNAGLSGRTGEIRASIGDVARRATVFSDAMDGCGRQVEQVAEHVGAIRAEAQRSRKAMGGLRQHMRALQTKSREISKVVLLVETVAYQTRLLSLNASVEAARAGPSGKGFAVVAQEVRELAKRSQQAAGQIATIVGSSIAEIESGSLMTERAAEAVRHTDEKVESVSGLMADIVRLTHTSQVESQAVLGITRTVEDSAGGNAKLVEQLSAASADLRDQGDSLKRSVQHFVFA